MTALSTDKINLFLILSIALLSISNAHSSTSINIHQNGDMVSWHVTGNTYTIESIQLTITGSEGSGSSQTGCTSSPLNCSFNFTSSNASFETSDLTVGSYNWKIEVIPLIIFGECDPSNVRELQGGLQGLNGNGGNTPEDLYLQCLIDAGLIPQNEQELFTNGVFTIETDNGLIVPDDSNPVPDDNLPPVAICQNVIVDGNKSNSCLVDADIDDFSYGPDGTITSLIQNPEGPYGLGQTNVTLTVTDNEGESSSCNANVTVIDDLLPEIQCPKANTMTPRTTPATFTATVSDTCGVSSNQVVSYNCYRINPNGMIIDTNDSCVVTTTNDSITVLETSGVNSFIDWNIEAIDNNGNGAQQMCTIEVLHPNS